MKLGGPANGLRDYARLELLNVTADKGLDVVL